MDITNSEARKFKYETHLHTKEGSACADSTGAQMVRAHYEAGYSGIIITDHFFNGNTTIPSNIPWEKRVELLYAGYDNAVEEAKDLPFSVFFGWEYADNGTEFLTYGLGKDFLLPYPDILSWSVEKYLTIARQNGAFISQAHPFREVWYIKKIRLFPEYVDAIEVCNASHTNPKFDERALELAREYSLYQTAGSDTHSIDCMYGGGMFFDHELNSIEEFIQAVKEWSLRSENL